MSKWIAEFDLEDGDTMPEHMDLEYKGTKIDFHCKPLKQEFCSDAISRQAAKKALEDRFVELQKRHDDKRYETNYCLNTILELPPVTPQSKIGKWIMIDKELQRYKCSKCGEVIRLYKKNEIPKLEKDEILSNYPFSHCGCRMIDSQKSEDTDD